MLCLSNPKSNAKVTRVLALPNQPRSMATDATDEGDEEAHALYHHTHPPGYGG